MSKAKHNIDLHFQTHTVSQPTREILPGVNMVFQVTITSLANPALCWPDRLSCETNLDIVGDIVDSSDSDTGDHGLARDARHGGQHGDHGVRHSYTRDTAARVGHCRDRRGWSQGGQGETGQEPRYQRLSLPTATCSGSR